MYKQITDKERALRIFLDSTAKKYGDAAAKLYTGTSEKEVFDIVSTGSALLDDALGVGGWPRGRIIEIFGDEGSGKTSACCIASGNAQIKYPEEYTGWVDIEHALNWNYAQQLKMRRDRTIFSQPSSGEQALDEVLEMVRSGAFSVVVLDSVGGLRTKRQLEKEFDEATIGEVARLMSNALPPISEAAKKTNTLVMFINQMRTNIGAYGSPPTTMGGKALKFFASIRLQVKKQENIVDQFKNPIGQVQDFIVKKNRMGIPFREISTEFFFGKGFNAFKEIIDIAIDKGLILKGGSWFYPNPSDKTFKFQGKDAVINHYSENQNSFNDLRDRVKILLEDGEIKDSTQNVGLMSSSKEVGIIDGKNEATAA